MRKVYKLQYDYSGTEYEIVQLTLIDIFDSDREAYVRCEDEEFDRVELTKDLFSSPEAAIWAKRQEFEWRKETLQRQEEMLRILCYRENI